VRQATVFGHIVAEWKGYRIIDENGEKTKFFDEMVERTGNIGEADNASVGNENCTRLYLRTRRIPPNHRNNSHPLSQPFSQFASLIAVVMIPE